MERPSKSWQNGRKAALERAKRKIIDPLEPLFAIYAAVCMFFVVGSLRFRFFEFSADFTWIEAIQVILVAFAGIMVPILTGSVLIVQLASRRLQKLAGEC